MNLKTFTKMKTIEERAWNSAVARMQGDSYYALGYKEGATEQKSIDIDNACEWLRVRNVLTEDSIKGFRKSMEE